ncbi:hypothetical protein BJF79_07400 [Actinomadura sp. CNU-125]|uniref:hypothetical protein n=1 Tax=Actinomadura sp. CNU-125 TaxID=1904961 RepID=UPI000962FC7E|nr:hypothetical protein [Actinomadura sp. CNU-125]OLT34384.1 hypothetical protein BJF79_07400 [Actinomadura sp. CNU-125]
MELRITAVPRPEETLVYRVECDGRHVPNGEQPHFASLDLHPMLRERYRVRSEIVFHILSLAREVGGVQIPVGPSVHTG